MTDSRSLRTPGIIKRRETGNVGKENRQKSKIKYQYDGYLFSFPIVLMMGALILYPMLYGFYISFFNTNLVTKWKFVGLKYYMAAFTEPEFYQSVLLTLGFMVLVVAGHFILGFILASLLNREFRGRTIFRVILCFPGFSGSSGGIIVHLDHESHVRYHEQHPQKPGIDQHESVMAGK